MSSKVDNKGGSFAGVAQWKKQLVTKEDAFHIHKTLGMLCLVSFLFRLALAGESDMGFGAAQYPALTVPTIVLHLLLSLSALEFKIPQRRISSGYRIWPEYRLHSIGEFFSLGLQICRSRNLSSQLIEFSHRIRF